MPLVINDTSFAGSVRDFFITELMTGAQSIEKGLVHVLGDIDKKDNVPTLKVSNFIQAHVERPVHGGKIEVGVRELVPVDLMGFLLFNPRQFEAHWKAVEMSPNLLDAELPVTAEAAIVNEVIKLNKKYMDSVLWKSVHDATAVTDAIANGLGDGDSNLIFLDGLIKKMFDDNDVSKVGSPISLTSGNIVSKLEAVAGDSDSTVYEDPNFTFILSPKSGRLYSDAQKAQTYKGVDITQRGAMEFDGKPVEIVAGQFDDTIVGTLASDDITTNLFVGVNKVNEETVLDLKKYRPEGESWFIKMLAKFDTNYGRAEDIVLYTTQTFT